MADRIKGITVEIGGDVTGLKKSLSDVDKQIGNTQKQLKDIDKLLKLDPTNTELLQQKQKLLAQAVADTSTRLSALRDAEKQAQEQFKQGKISQEQYDALKREIIATEQQLKSLEGQAKNTGTALSASLQEAGRKVSEFGGSVTDVGKKFMPVTAALSAAGVAGVKVFTDFDDAMRQVQATMGGTQSDYEKLSAAARDAGATTRYSATEAANALNYLALAGYDADKSIETLPKVLQLAAAGNLDLAYASDLVTDSMAALGKSADELDEYIDQMAKTSQKSNTSIAQLGEATLVVAGQASLAKMPLSDMNTALGILADNGIKGSEGGTALRNVLKNLYTPTEKAADKMSALGIATANADGSLRNAQDVLQDLAGALDGLTEAERMDAMGTIFDSRTIAGANALLKDSGDRWNELSAMIDGAEGSAANMAETLESGIGGQFRELKSSVEELGIILGEALAPMVSRLIGRLKDLSTWFQGLDNDQKEMIVTIGLVLAAIGPLLVAGGQIISGAGTVITLIGTLSSVVIPALSAALTFLAANPVVLVIAAIVAVIVIIQQLWDKNEAFREAVTNIWSKITGVFQAFDDWLKDIFEKDWTESFGVFGIVLNAFFDVVQQVWTGIKEWFGGIIEFLAGVFTGDWERVWNGVQQIFSGIFNSLKSIALAPINFIIGLLNGLINGINTVIDGLNSMVDGIPDKLKKKFGIDDFSIDRISTISLLGTAGKSNNSGAQFNPDYSAITKGNTTITRTGDVTEKSAQIVQNNTFNNYEPKDGAAVARDLNRQLGRVYS